uniref:Variant surface glycoprotein 1125.2589 n=1 Tax=Trypanosoma brucei TaxID=5691 RepID=A0A1J0R8G4_9TRYP|nr:variant surface glycoprotein 1125.2589 [Trypanosoma brucei]
MIELAGERSTVVKRPTALEDILDELLELNMTITQPAWIDLFRDKDKPDTPKEFKADNSNKQTDWPARWDTWKKQAAKILKPADLAGLQARHKIQNIKPQKLATLRRRVQNLAAQAEEIRLHAEKEAPAGDFMDDKAVQATINKAVYRQTVEPEIGAEVPKAFNNPSGGRTTNCAGGKDSTKATTALAVLTCIFAKDSGNGANGAKACTGTALNSEWTTNANPAQAVTDELRKLCNKPRASLLTTEKLENRISAFTSLLKRTSGGSFFGAHESDCNGTTTGACVKYTRLTDAAGDPLTDINWVKDLHQLGTKLTKHEEAVAMHKAAAAQIRTLTQLAKRLIYEEDEAEITAAASAPIGARSNDKEIEAKVQDKKKECEAITKGAECTKNGNCKWEGCEAKEGNHCKLNRKAVENTSRNRRNTNW